MRWDRLFDDLEGQLEQELGAEELDEHAEGERLRLGRLALRDRLVALHDELGDEETLAIVLADGDLVSVRPTDFGRDWFVAELLDTAHRRTRAIIPFSGVAALQLTRGQVEASLTPAAEPGGASTLSARLTLPFVLRDLCRRRAAVDLRTTTGSVHGTIDRVGRDHLDLAVHERGQSRRESSVQHYRVVPLDQLLLVRL
jgi:hypothetical protein